MIPTLVSPAINHLLARESWAREKLARHAGKVACFDTGVLAVFLKVGADGMVQEAQGDTPSVTIRVQLSDLPLILQNPQHAFSHVQIEGDADFANTISQLGQSLRWEAEEDLSKLIGDIAATRVVGGVRTAIDIVRNTHARVAENLAEYFLEENPVLVRPEAITEFSAEVNKLRDDVERLSKRIDKLKGSR